VRKILIERGSMRFVVIIASLAATLALASTATAEAPAAAAAKSTTIDAVITGTGCGITGTSCGGNCCLQFWDFAGRANIFHPPGSLRFTGSYVEGGIPFSDPAMRIRNLTLTFVAGNGDQLVLDESATWLATDPVPTPMWSVDQALSTGRFAGYTGSGGYSMIMDCASVDSDGNCTSERFTIPINGTLTSAP
jgi:hypothetical protein